MKEKDKKKTKKPETLMMHQEIPLEWMQGSIKAPIFQTSTFFFKTAEEGKAIFETANGLREQNGNNGLIYSRLNNPNLAIVEEKLAIWDKTETAAVFESGIAAISTTLLNFLRPNDLILHSNALYSGTNNFIKNMLPQFGINQMEFKSTEDKNSIIEKIKKANLSQNLKVIYIETPANPTNELFDIQLCREVEEEFSTEEKQIIIIADNTYMGPIWQNPLELGADINLYSATKYLAGHSDVIAGAVVGKKEYIDEIKALRLFLGNMASPHTSWLLNRSLETLKIRMDKQAENAQEIAKFLHKHSKIEQLYSLDFLEDNSQQKAIFEKQYSSAGAMISFKIKGGEKEAFTFLNNLQIFKIAVSLGSTESLAQHPFTMTHSGVALEDRINAGITENMIRLSIGIENIEDLLWDLENALSFV